MPCSFPFLNRVRARRAGLRGRGAHLALIGAALLVGGALVFRVSQSPAQDRQGSATSAIEVLAAGDLRGEIHPCGCSPDLQWGGLPRRLTFLQQAFDASPHQPPIVVDLGNNFPEPTDQGKLKIALIQDMLKQFPPDAILPGPNELAVGLDTLDRALPYLLSNDAVGKVFLPEVGVVRGGTRVGIYGYLSPGEVYQEFAGQYRLQNADAPWIARLRDRIRVSRPDRTILLFRGGDAELKALHASGLFDLIVSGNPFSDEVNQVVRREVDGAVIPQVPTKGQGFYRLSLDGPDRETLSGPVYLKENYPDHPVAVHAFAIYDEHVKGLFFARLETLERNRAESPYAGATACAACHVKAYETWKTSRHGHALATLERVKKNYDPECLQCHTVGMGDNGFLSQDLTPHLGNVQCENCHGPAKAHAADPQNVKPARIAKAMAETGSPERVCRTCHHGSHSPRFAVPVYWPKIAHGKD